MTNLLTPEITQATPKFEPAGDTRLPPIGKLLQLTVVDDKEYPAAIADWQAFCNSTYGDRAFLELLDATQSDD